MKNKAFSIIEVLVIVGIIGIFALFAVPAYRLFQPSLQLNGAVRELITDLRYIQQMAVTEQVEYCIKFFLSEKRYQVIECESVSPIKEVVLSDKIKTLILSGFSSNEVRYNPYGAVREEGQITLENTKNETKTILVKSSGFVKVSD